MDLREQKYVCTLAEYGNLTRAAERLYISLPAVMEDYEKKWPDIDLVIRDGNLSSLNEMLKNGELDMIVLNRTPETDSMETELLFQEEFLVAVPVCHPINEKAEYEPGSRYRKLKPEALNGETLILHTSWQSSRKIEDSILKKYQVTPGRILHTGHGAPQTRCSGSL